MERKIKFRGQDKDNNWVYGDLIHGVGHKEGILYILPLQRNLANIPNCDVLDGVKIESETVGQFTGLVDKNGVKIYEGDIFHLGDKIILHVVEWIDSGFKGRQISNKSTVGLEYWQDIIEIIGNIHDNSELLNNLI